MRRKWRENNYEKQTAVRYQEIISRRNKQRIHTFPLSQLSSNLVCCSGICGRQVGDRVTEFNG
jgi:hypothetical protein